MRWKKEKFMKGTEECAWRKKGLSMESKIYTEEEDKDMESEWMTRCWELDVRKK